MTDLVLSESNVRQLARGGRARWRIENETFNTLKNQGYHVEHHLGHGEKNLSAVMACLMLAAFLIDPVQQKWNLLFPAAWQKTGPKCALWDAVRPRFASFDVASMREVYEGMAFGFPRPRLQVLIERSQGKARSDDTS